MKNTNDKTCEEKAGIEKNDENSKGEAISMWFVLILIGIICFLPILFTRPAKWEWFDFSHTGEIGSTIGGIMGPFIAIIAAGLTYKAFIIQYEANKELRKTTQSQEEALKIQKQQYEDQRVDIEKERFENKYFKMLDVYREAANFIHIENIGTGNIAFHYMYYEFKSLYILFQKLCTRDNIMIEKKDMVKIAFVIFYYGITEGENYTIKHMLREQYNYSEEKMVEVERFINEVLEIQRCQKCFCIDKKGICSNHCKNEMIKIERLKKKVGFLHEYLDYGQKFKIYDGHMFNLSSYFLFIQNIIEYVISQKEYKKVDEKNDEFYIEFLRSQLGAHETVLLYFYGISEFNPSFEYKKYFEKYDILKYISIGTISQVISFEEANLDI